MKTLKPWIVGRGSWVVCVALLLAAPAVAQDWGRYANDATFAPPPAVGVNLPQPSVFTPPSIPAPARVSPPTGTPPGWIGPLETGFPGPTYRVPGAGRTFVYIDPVGRAWYLPATGPKPMIEMPKAFDAEKYYRDIIYPKLRAQGLDAPAPRSGK